MSKKSHILAPLALACGLLSAGAAQATMTMYTSRAAFTAALTGTLVDSYDDLVAGAAYASPAAVTLGSYGYTAVAPAGLFAAGTAADTWLGTWDALDALSLGSFTGGAVAVGANFFLSDADGNFAADGNFTVTGFDANSSLSQTFAVSSLSNFVGFISDAGGVSAVVMSNNLPVTGAGATRFATINDLTIGAVPEPGTYALALAGLGLIALRRRRAA